jgi:hypothetical protein
MCRNSKSNKLVNEFKVKLFENREDYTFRLIIEKLILVSLSILYFPYYFVFLLKCILEHWRLPMS